MTSERDRRDPRGGSGPAGRRRSRRQAGPGARPPAGRRRRARSPRRTPAAALPEMPTRSAGPRPPRDEPGDAARDLNRRFEDLERGVRHRTEDLERGLADRFRDLDRRFEDHAPRVRGPRPRGGGAAGGARTGDERADRGAGTRARPPDGGIGAGDRGTGPTTTEACRPTRRAGCAGPRATRTVAGGADRGGAVGLTVRHVAHGRRSRPYGDAGARKDRGRGERVAPAAAGLLVIAGSVAEKRRRMRCVSVVAGVPGGT